MKLRNQVANIFIRDLFPTPGPSTDTQKFEVTVDSTVGSASPNVADPNASGFGFYIMSGTTKCRTIVPQQFLTLSRRLGCNHESQ
jgi:hypothetical protein